MFRVKGGQLQAFAAVSATGGGNSNPTNFGLCSLNYEFATHRISKTRRRGEGPESANRSCGKGFEDSSQELRIAPRSPWQSPYVEGFIGSLRRDCLDHLIVLNRAPLHRVLESYLAYYHGARTHLGLDKDAPEPRLVQQPWPGKIVAFPEVGGLHHRYDRRAA